MHDKHDVLRIYIRIDHAVYFPQWKLGMTNHVDITVNGTHTIGMIIQKYAESFDDVMFMSYNQVHPLEKRINIKLASPDLLGTVTKIFSAIVEDIDSIMAHTTS